MTPDTNTIKRTLLADDESDIAVEQHAEQQRVAAFQAAHHWRGIPLRWTSSRASRYLWLKLPSVRLEEETLAALRASCEAPDDAALQQHANELYQRDTAGDQSHYHNATIILYLAANEPQAWKDFAHDKARFIDAIEKWTDDHVAPGEIFELAEVTNQLIAAAESTRAIVRPSHRGEDEQGN